MPFLIRRADIARTRPGAGFWAVLVTIALLVGGASRAHAQQEENADAIAKATQLNKEAITAYQAHKTDDAKRLLKQALDLCDASGLDQHPVKARTLIHFGIVLIGGSKQRELGIKQFKKALAIESDIGLTKALITPELQQAFDEAKKGEAKGEAKAEAKPDKGDAKPDFKPAPVATAESSGDVGEETGPSGAATAPTTPPEAATPPAAPAATPAVTSGETSVPSTGLDHEPVTRARPGTAISITVNIEEGLKFQKLVLAYRPNGAANFLGREMTQVDPGIYSAEIPARATSGTMVAYYIEAQDQNGEPVAARGSDAKPLVIMLGETRVSKKPDKSDDDDDDDDEDENSSKFFTGLTIGSGAGYAKGNGDLDRVTQYSSGGFALAQAVHIAPELGYWLRPDLMVSLQIRYQYITGPTGIKDPMNGQLLHPANFALAAFGKATWMLGHGSLHPLFSLAAGFGQIRHVVKHPTLKDCGADMQTDCIDTIAAGLFLGGVGAGVMYTLTPHVALLAVANSQIGLPNFTFNLDGNIGAAYMF